MALIRPPCFMTEMGVTHYAALGSSDFPLVAQGSGERSPSEERAGVIIPLWGEVSLVV